MFRKQFLLASSVALVSLFAATNQANAATYFVDPATGSDSNPGTQALPFKTITQGIAAPSPEGELLSIILAAGNYSQSSGESFNWHFVGASKPVRIAGAGIGASVIDVGTASSCMSPTNINIYFDSISLRNCSVLVSGSAASLSFNNAALENFYSNLRGQSVVRIDNSFISGTSGFYVDQQSRLIFTNTDVDGAGSLASDFIVLVQQSTLRADDLFIHDLVVSNLVLDVLDGSTADLTNSTIQDSWGTGFINSFVGDPVTIRAVGEGTTLRLTNSQVKRSAGVAILGDSGPFIRINGGTYTGNKIGVYGYNAATYLNNDLAFAGTARFSSTLANWRVEGPDAFALIDMGTFIGGSYGIQSYNNARISVSNSRFRVSRPIQFESIDARQSQWTLGTNLWFISNGASDYISVVANCTQPVSLFVGNTTWIKNVQAADASGKIAPQTIKGPKKGGNYWLKNSNCKLETF